MQNYGVPCVTAEARAARGRLRSDGYRIRRSGIKFFDFTLSF